MRHLFFLTLILSLTPVWAQTVRYPRSVLLNGLKHLGGVGTLEPSVNNFCQENIQDIVVEKCGPKAHKGVAFAYDLANVDIERLNRQIAPYFRNPKVRSNPARMKMLKTIREVVSCVKERLKSGLHFRCEANCDRGVLAFVQLKNKNLIHLCSLSLQQKIRFTATTMIHEASHFCSTEDYDYYYDLSMYDGTTAIPLRAPARKETNHDFKILNWKFYSFTTVNKPEWTADSYGYWADQGFCLPGLDCKDPPKEVWDPKQHYKTR
jgi:hypothetical protein